jgi:hypothetical protein
MKLGLSSARRDSMFRIDTNMMRVLFTMGERDLALAFVEMEGYDIVTWGEYKRKSSPALVTYDVAPGGRGNFSGSEPEQVSPGIFSYAIGKKSRRQPSAQVKATNA